jgi:RNA polymerase sigma-70 factor (ECF subfamily)
MSRENAMPDSPQQRHGHKQPTPLSLLDRARARDPGAWGRLVALYRPLILFWCGRQGVADGDLEDVAQEVLAAVSRDLGAFRRDRLTDSFRGWLRVVTRNQVLAHFRRNQGRPVAEGGSDAQRRMQAVADPLGFEDEQEKEQMNRLYREGVNQIRREFEEATWRAFWRTAIDERSPDSLVEELGMSSAAIRQAKSRVLRRLKQELGDVLQ